MKTLKFRLETGDRNAGTVYLPDSQNGRIPVLVYCHGWGASQKLPPVMTSLWPRFEDVGAGLLAFDFFGCGETGGDYGQMSYGRWHRNLGDVFEWIAKQPWADPARTGCFAISSGTTAMLRFAAASRAPAYAISVASCIGAFIQMPNSPGRIMVEHLDDLVAGRTAELFGTHFGLEFFRDFLTAAPVYTLRAITCPVFFLQGGADNPWRRADAWLGYQLLKAQGAKYLEIEDGDHCLDTVADKAAAETFTWLRTIGCV
jgi:pimeloyl-ACP methyl ester carboxylesterase